VVKKSQMGFVHTMGPGFNLSILFFDYDFNEYEFSTFTNIVCSYSKVTSSWLGNFLTLSAHFFETYIKPNYFKRSNVLHYHFYFPKVIILVQTGLEYSAG
jgi:hypothetical protein